MSRVTEHGLPHSVNNAGQLPNRAYDGHLCYVKGDGLYIYNGSAYEKMLASNAGGDDALKAPNYATVTAFPTNATAGQLAFAESTKAVYVYNGTNWKKLTEST